MITKLTLKLTPEQAQNCNTVKLAVAQVLNENVDNVNDVRILKQSIDARQRNVAVQLTVNAFVNESTTNDQSPKLPDYLNVANKKSVVVVGAGPAGLFAAMKLIEKNLKPIILERGKNVHERKKDVANISRYNLVNPDSNLCFGEGGAGTFSDGKLFTRSKKKGDVQQILHILCAFGADNQILTDAHPHIGSDQLPKIVENIRNWILKCGGEIFFNTRMETLLLHHDNVVGVKTHNGLEFKGSVVLATGHSARDVYRELYRLNAELQPKALALGVRLEHPQMLIDQIRYHNPNGKGNFLPPAEYRFATQVNDRGVYSFCMCPGGFVVPVAVNSQHVAVNGMSTAKRNSPWANAGIVVEIQPNDLNDPLLLPYNNKLMIDKNSPLALMLFQEYLETLAWNAGGQKQSAPAQKMMDFFNEKTSITLPNSSYTPGLQSYPLHELLPKFVAERLKHGFLEFNRVSKGFLTNEAVMIGIETRTSAPVRILRNATNCQHVRLKNLFPCGEGAGYAGGIVSAAIDGRRCADCVPS